MIIQLGNIMKKYKLEKNFEQILSIEERIKELVNKNEKIFLIISEDKIPFNQMTKTISGMLLDEKNTKNISMYLLSYDNETTEEIKEYLFKELVIPIEFTPAFFLIKEGNIEKMFFGLI